MKVEVCANSLDSAREAIRGGADRLEFCAELGVGGLTPSAGMLRRLREEVQIPVHVLIRPRGGHFTYSDAEMEVMLADIEFCKQLGYEGVVSGALSGDGIPDLERTSQLLEAAAPMQFVFHRAIDWVADPLSWIQPLTDIGVNTILSSGGAKTAAEGLELLKAMDRLNPACRIIPASGVGAQNAQLFLGAGFSWIHLSGSRPYNPLNTPAKLSMYSARMLRDEVVYRTDADAIRALRQALNKM